MRELSSKEVRANTNSACGIPHEMIIKWPSNTRGLTPRKQR
eukprot:gene6492-9365_t